jgi:hypothetical protein
MQKVIEGSSIVLGVFLVFLVQNSPLINYTSYILAILIIFSAIYISLKKRSFRSGKNKSGEVKLFSGSPIELFALTSIIVFIIALTSGISSPLFFFLYFMLFLLAFMCTPVTIWIFLIAILLYFIPEALNSLNIDTFIRLGSLALIAPIAYFIGVEFDRRALLNKRISSKTDEIIQEAQNLKDEHIDPEEKETIDEIIEEAASLKEDAED